MYNGEFFANEGAILSLRRQRIICILRDIHDRISGYYHGFNI